jgi:hypothetical protein
MTYQELVNKVGEERAIVIYDYFVDWTIEDLVNCVLDTFTVGQLVQLAKELNDED